MLWGWMQIGEKPIKIDKIDPKQKPWARYHPHFHMIPEKSNTLYIASDELVIDGKKVKGINGAGVFSHYNKDLQLTKKKENQDLVNPWYVPEWFHHKDPDKRLTYNRAEWRWIKCGKGYELTTQSPGQEYVLDCDYYPEAEVWVKELITNNL